jgi:hypothetical protein
MSDIDGPDSREEPPAPRGQPRRSRLRRILDERPESRPRLARAIGALAATTLVAIAAVGGLLIWHVMRRARLIRERLAPPRAVELPELPGRPPERSA